MSQEWKPTDDQLVCRDIRHTWEPYDAWKENRGYVRVLKCSRCKTTRTQELDRQGYVLNSKMSYPAGYLRKDGGRLTADERADIRTLNLERNISSIRKGHQP